MGFWSSFFGHATADAYNEIKKEEKDTQKWNDNFFAKQSNEEEFSNYLESIGSNAIYISKVDKSATFVKKQIGQYKRKIQEYLNLGGLGKYIYDVEEIDEYIELMKYLKSVDCIERQEEFLGLDLCFAQDTLEREKEEQNQRKMGMTEILSSDINSLSGIEFEKVCQQLIESMGFETETTKASGDGGIDLIAYNHQPLISGKYIIQCKRYTGSVGEPIIRDLYGVVTSERANKGILMTTGTFTKSAINFADGKPIELISGAAMQNLFSQYGMSYGFASDKICLKDEAFEIISYDISAEERIACIETLNQFCDYTALKNVLFTDSNNCSLRSRIIDMITYTYFSDNRLSCDLPMQQYKYKRCLSQMLREEIKWFYEYADDSDIKIQAIRDFYFLYLAQIELTQGDFYDAFKLYNKGLSSKTYRDCRIECENASSNNDIVLTVYGDTLLMIVMNMCQILAVLGLGDCANRLKSKYKYLIGFYTDIAATTYAQHPDNYWAKIEYEWCSNSCTPYALRFIVFEEEYFNNLENNLYDGSIYNNLIVDSTLTTYSELRKINIDQEDLFIDNTVCFDYQDILRKNREKIKQLFV